MKNAMRKKRERKPAVVGRDDDGLLAQIANRRADAWAHAPAGTPYDNREIREIAKVEREAGR